MQAGHTVGYAARTRPGHGPVLDQLRGGAALQ